MRQMPLPYIQRARAHSQRLSRSARRAGGGRGAALQLVLHVVAQPGVAGLRGLIVSQRWRERDTRARLWLRAWEARRLRPGLGERVRSRSARLTQSSFGLALELRLGLAMLAKVMTTEAPARCRNPAKQTRERRESRLRSAPADAGEALSLIQVCSMVWAAENLSPVANADPRGGPPTHASTSTSTAKARCPLGGCENTLGVGHRNSASSTAMSNHAYLRSP